MSVNGLIKLTVRGRQIIEGRRKAACIWAMCGRLGGTRPRRWICLREHVPVTRANKHQSLRRLWAPSSRWETYFLPEHYNHAKCLHRPEKQLQRSQQRCCRASQGETGREAAALHIPGPEQPINNTLEYQLSKVPS